MTALGRAAVVWALAVAAAVWVAVEARSAVAGTAAVILAAIPLILAWGLAHAPTKTVAEIIHDAESR